MAMKKSQPLYLEISMIDYFQKRGLNMSQIVTELLTTYISQAEKATVPIGNEKTYSEVYSDKKKELEYRKFLNQKVRDEFDGKKLADLAGDDRHRFLMRYYQLYETMKKVVKE